MSVQSTAYLRQRGLAPNDSDSDGEAEHVIHVTASPADVKLEDAPAAVSSVMQESIDTARNIASFAGEQITVASQATGAAVGRVAADKILAKANDEDKRTPFVLMGSSDALPFPVPHSCSIPPHVASRSLRSHTPEYAERGEDTGAAVGTFAGKFVSDALGFIFPLIAGYAERRNAWGRVGMSAD